MVWGGSFEIMGKQPLTLTGQGPAIPTSCRVHADLALPGSRHELLQICRLCSRLLDRNTADSCDTAVRHAVGFQPCSWSVPGTFWWSLGTARAS